MNNACERDVRNSERNVLVSVIIPIYNASSHINKGIQYILNQTYQNIEILLVDDGSTDNSGEICDALTNFDNRIRVFHQTNMGSGAARNLGLAKAQGKYVYFFDIDDSASPELVSYCVEEMEKREVDFLLFGFKAIDVTNNNREENIAYKEQEIFSNQQLKGIYLDTFVFPKHGNGFPWNKFYRLSFLNQHKLRFENLRIQQDEVFNLNIYPHLDKSFISSRVLYTYYIHSNGNSRSQFIPDRFNIYISVREHFEALKDFWHISNPIFDDYLIRRFYNGLDASIRFNLFHQDCKYDIQKKKRLMKEILVHPLSKEAISYMENVKLNMENKCYLREYVRCSFVGIRFWNYLFKLLRRIKRVL
ncbi:glycosyltransferase family 2 protein [Prevotella sp. kh1p2]|uniref:glycosyltransferase family 2 protein n=1 Tax=Prevotella sp. kh1p2 TaxID=1761883 RepID=UPI0008AD630B|nr:glycosyltransferase family 2 protein [Prevotella sp. kh1p2]SET10918.1 Glycosyltransferase involved in cell wall bisynthesis [Prevotella sp. kh1p2]SNU11838.1 Glycosyltransferase involved in cell wall bisynthesis [Prevotellaceae bacterium KH2P17]